MPTIFDRMTIGGMPSQIEQDPLYNINGSDYAGLQIAAQMRKDEEERRRKAEEEQRARQQALEQQLQQQQAQRQQQMEPLQQPLEQMIRGREQREGVGGARSTIIETLRAAAQGKDYKPITDKIREEETKTHAANMAQMRAMDLEQKLTQRETELQQRNMWEAQKRANEEAKFRGQQESAQRLAWARTEAARLAKEGKLGVAEINAIAQAAKTLPERVAALAAGVGKQDPNNPHDVVLDLEGIADPNKTAAYAALREKMVSGGKKSGGGQQVIGSQSNRTSFTDASGLTTGSTSYRKILAPQEKSNTFDDVIGIMRQKSGLEAQPQKGPNVMERLQIGQMGGQAPAPPAATRTLGKVINRPQTTWDKIAVEHPEVFFDPKAIRSPNGDIELASMGRGQSMIARTRWRKYEEERSSADQYAGQFRGTTQQVADMYNDDKLRDTMLTNESQNPLARAVLATINQKTQDLRSKGLLSGEALTRFNFLSTLNLKNLQEKMTSVGGKTLTESERRIVEQYWPDQKFSNEEDMLKRYAAFNLLLASQEYKLRKGMSFSSDAANELTRNVPKWVEGQTKILQELRTKAKAAQEAGDQGTYNQIKAQMQDETRKLLDTNQFFDRIVENKYNPKPRKKLRI